jgi:signal transduction histidine kinase
MEALRISTLVFCLVGIFFLAPLGLGLRTMYRRGIRRYERMLDNTYSKQFEQRTIIARSVHPVLAQIIHRSKSAVDRAREKPANGPETTDALKQVSEWLAGAASESDRALRLLESGSFTAFNNGQIARGEHVDTKTHSHNGR